MGAPALAMSSNTSADDAVERQGVFRIAMRQLASGVSIIAAGEGDNRAGIVASSVTSFSVEPPTLLVSIAQTSSLSPVLRDYGHFSANILRASQFDLADRFSGRTGIARSQRFDAGNWISLVTGAPVLADALASIDCEVEEIIERHTHAIVLGRVSAVRVDKDDDALGHWSGQFFSVREGAGLARQP